MTKMTMDSGSTFNEQILYLVRSFLSIFSKTLKGNVPNKFIQTRLPCTISQMHTVMDSENFLRIPRKTYASSKEISLSY